jgi:ABC-type ATPase with predicted acetyltransferase domain
MTSLVACLGKTPATIAHVAEIVKKEEWDKVYIITEEKPVNFPKEKVEFIMIDEKQMLPVLAITIQDHLRSKIRDMEVAINLVSGSGKLHTATLSALLKIGLAIRLVVLTPQGVKEI